MMASAAADLVHHNVSVADRLLRDTVTQSRRTLSDVRRMITRYQDVSLQAEIETAATLLQASGIPTVVEMPEIDLPVADPAVRARLRDEVARLLRDPPSGGRVIAVGVRAGRVSVAVRPRDVTVGAGADQ
jgi:hypothetical protein